MNTKKNKHVGNDRKRQKSASTDPTPFKKQKNNKNKNNKKKHDNAKNKSPPPQSSSTEASSDSTIPSISIPVNHKSLLLDSTTPFHLIPTQNAIQTLTLEDETSNPLSGSSLQTEELKKTASELYSHELSLFTSLNPKTSDDRWISGTIRKGTYKDKIAAMSVQISSHPNHKLFVVDKLLSLCQNSPTRIGHIGAEALSDLFTNTLLPSNRKLIPWTRRPLSTLSSNPSPRTLLLWHVEDLVKTAFASFLSHLSRSLESPVAVDKIAALRIVAHLLAERMEGEGVLLSLIVNKLGDPQRKVAERAGEVLRRDVLGVHPLMNVVVAREVSQFAHRPGLSPRALYNAIVFLNQMRLERDTTTLAGRLVETYVGLFAAATTDAAMAEAEGTGGLSSRLLGALLTGINRARPYCSSSSDAVRRLAARSDELYAIVHLPHRPMASVQSLMLLQQIETADGGDGTAAPTARYHRALYAKLSQPSFLESKKASTLAFHLVYRTLKRDEEDDRRLAYAKRLLITAASSTASSPAPLCGSLFLLSKVHVNQGWEEIIPERRRTDDGKGKTTTNKRDPVSGGSLWELTLIRRHYHPSVAHFAESLATNRKIDYKGDPLKDFSNMKFLDRLAYRQPKRLEKKGDREDGTATVEDASNVFKKVIPGGMRRENPVNEEAFWGGQNKRVGVEDEFFVKFFRDKEKREGGKEKGTPVNEKNIDLEDIDYDTDPEEEEFANALAEKLMESGGEGRTNYDDEDPDMEGWSSTEDMSDNDENVDFAAMDGLGDEDEDVSDIDDDGKLIDADDEDSSVGNVDIDDDDDAFMDAQNDDSSDEEAAAAAAALDKPGKKTSKTMTKTRVRYQQQQERDENEKHLEISKPKEKKKKLSTQFHDASEYEELIAERWAEEKLLKHQQQSKQARDDDNATDRQKKENDESGVTNNKDKPKEMMMATTAAAGHATDNETTKKIKRVVEKPRKRRIDCDYTTKCVF